MALIGAIGSITAAAVFAAQRNAQIPTAAQTESPSNAWVEITIEYKGNQMIFPTNPEEIDIRRNTNNFTYDVLKLGEIILPNTPLLERISFTSLFWAERAPKESGEYVEWLNEWREEKYPARLVITNYDTEGTYHGLNMLVLCDSFDTNEGRAGAEDDVYYSLSLTQFREDLGSEEIEIEVDPNTGDEYYTAPPPIRVDESPPPSQVYTVVSGDSLWAITRRFNRPGTDWTELYAIPENRTIIGNNPDRIFPGQQLIIPESWL